MSSFFLYGLLISIVATLLLCTPKLYKKFGKKGLKNMLWAMLLFYLLYEASVPMELYIRVDLFFIYPVMIFVGMIALVRVRIK